jgi:hypothetical protein
MVAAIPAVAARPPKIEPSGERRRRYIRTELGVGLRFDPG